LALSSFHKDILLMQWAETRDKARLANAGEFTVSCGVLNLIPVLAVGSPSGPYFVHRMLTMVSSQPLSKKSNPEGVK
jgi:hypothetical protein